MRYGRYAPNGNPVYTNFELQGEYMPRHEYGEVTYAAANTAAYDAKQSGWYLQGVYQFMPYWRVGCVPNAWITVRWTTARTMQSGALRLQSVTQQYDGGFLPQ